MYNNYGNIESIEPENKIIDDRNSHKYVKEDAKESANETTGLIKNDTTYSTLNHSKSIYDPFREMYQREIERIMKNAKTL